MQEATERRAPQTSRVPLDQVLIDLSPEGFEQSFPADGVNLGRGGLSMRSAILPDVGSHLHCRFQSPHDGQPVDADCEVVWAHDSGENEGEFGLRFTGMTAEDQQAINDMVDAWNSDILADNPGAIADTASPIPRVVPHAMQRVQIRLDGVGPEIDADVAHRASDVLIVEQALPFVRLGTGVTEGGRRGILQSVDLRIEGDMPRLIMTVAYDSTPHSTPHSTPKTASAPGESTLADAHFELTPNNAPERIESVASDVEEQFFDESLGLDAPADDLEAASEALASDAFGVQAATETTETTGEDEAGREGVVATRYDASTDEEDEALARALRPDFKASMTKGLAKLKAGWVRVRALLAVAWIKAGPRVRAGGKRLRVMSGILGARLGTFFGALKARVQRRSTTVVPAKKIRTQGRTSTRKTTTEGTPPPQRNVKGLGRIALGVIVVGAAVFVVSGQSSADVATVLKAAAPPVVQLEVQDPELGDEIEFGPEEGLQVSPSAAPGQVPGDSPYAQDEAPVEEASVAQYTSGTMSNGRSYTLRMSVPPSGMRGQDTEDGIRVVILGSNAIDGARRIASADERIASASILNHGEEAELRLRFTEGERPAYRIESRRSSLVITIGE